MKNRYFGLFLIMCMCFPADECRCWKRPEVSDSAGVVVMGGCEPTDVGTGNWTQVLRKNSTCSYPLSHLSSPAYSFWLNNSSVSLHQFFLTWPYLKDLLWLLTHCWDFAIVRKSVCRGESLSSPGRILFWQGMKATTHEKSQRHVLLVKLNDVQENVKETE